MVVQFWSFSIEHIDDDIYEDSTSDGWRLIGFNGNLVMKQQRGSWERLVQLSRNNSTPRVCVGDFNEVLFQHEKLGGAVRPRWQI
ncbi:UNVERIFIED_CONTAM: hypothetical protein Slati_1406400 [Sesamum latifolium]|uniref:Exo_endo_phos domain-containing protein n=1 Tax=Sesamum latifolium TaxID=2727402 RepID=A0AAW2X8K1_9LAMI